MRWTVLVPFRGMPGAKSRLARGLSAEQHVLLVDAIRADTLSAVHAVEQVARVVVIGDISGPGVTLVQQSRGLNGALRDGWRFAVQRWPEDGVAALVGDLPALRPAELSAALECAATHPRSYVPDAGGTGTTLLAAAPGAVLDPRFGRGSAARHSTTGGHPLDSGPGLRHDVDTVDDLKDAIALGVGEHTAGAVSVALNSLRSPLRGMMAT